MGHNEIAAPGGRSWTDSGEHPNVYNLLNRQFETGLAEMSIRKTSDYWLIHMAFGVLSGKYLAGQSPQAPAYAV